MLMQMIQNWEIHISMVMVPVLLGLAIPIFTVAVLHLPESAIQPLTVMGELQHRLEIQPSAVTIVQQPV